MAKIFSAARKKTTGVNLVCAGVVASKPLGFCGSPGLRLFLGKGEVESSILSGSTTINLFKNLASVGAALFSQPIDHRKHESDENSRHHEGKDQADIVSRHPGMITGSAV